MKRTMLAVIALFATAGAFAQKNYSESASFQWGPKVGLNISTMTNTDGSKMKPSVYVGAFAEFRVLDWMGIQPEVLYSRQGLKSNVDGIEHKYRFNYLNIPILAKFYVFDGLSLDTGPQFGILLNANDKYKEDGEKIKNDIEGAKNFDISWAIGLSYKFLSHYDVSFRYNLGLSKVFDVSGDKPKNSVIQIGMGYRF